MLTISAHDRCSGCKRLPNSFLVWALCRYCVAPCILHWVEIPVVPRRTLGCPLPSPVCLTLSYGVCTCGWFLALFYAVEGSLLWLLDPIRLLSSFLPFFAYSSCLCRRPSLSVCSSLSLCINSLSWSLNFSLSYFSSCVWRLTTRCISSTFLDSSL